MDSIDCVVIGAGVIGLAVARALALDGREVVILEAADAFGTGVSARSSEVIHAGIYYPRGSLKATLCVAGRELLYPFCARAGVEHRCCGKLIVATSDEQVEDLRLIDAAARGNGVTLEWMSAATVRDLEPELNCRAALFSPLTGIIDTHGYMQALLGEAEQAGAILAVRNSVMRMWLETSSVLLAVNQNERPDLRANLVINCAGLHATQVAAGIEGFPAEHIPRAHYARGHYFSTTSRSPFRHLIYPVPEPGGLGVHLTLDLAGQARFGPDVEWVEQLDYSVSLDRADRFYGAIRRFWPALSDGSLVPAYAGIRPKISGPGEPAADFRIDGPARHGIAQVINLFGIESPGITSSLAIADHVAALARHDKLSP
ncbi:NAD(P)/FAD-dependent oxidoreductase [Povalibacter sp.]|uniref:NAD(P)/FAD-dependent oxidoreductase n=1 Tax=Povalibacter sp. TaxID=1962978 RepID=UPI002F410096